MMGDKKARESLDAHQALREFCSEVALLKFRAGNLGLYKTMHALEAGVTAVGYEIAEQIEKNQKPKRTPKVRESLSAVMERRAGRAK